MKASLLNWAPWSVLNISGLPFLRASFNASTQKSASRVFESLQEITYRLYQSILATSLPQGQYQVGQEVPVTVTLRRSDSHPEAPVGVRVKIRDGAGNTYEVSGIVVLSGRETRSVTLLWTVPASASNGSYDIEVST